MEATAAWPVAYSRSSTQPTDALCLAPRLYISYGVSLLGTGQVLTLKYLLRKGFDIEIESSSVENRASINYRK